MASTDTKTKMPLQTKMRFIFSILLVLLFLFTGYQSIGYATLARYLPFAVSALGVVLGVLAIVSDYTNYRRRGVVAADEVQETAAMYGAEHAELKRKKEESDGGAGDGAGMEVEEVTSEAGVMEAAPDPREVVKRAGSTVLWVLGYIVAIWVIGIVIASALFLAVYLLWVAKARWTLPAVGIALVWTGMYVMKELINLEWPPYLLEDVIYLF